MDPTKDREWEAAIDGADGDSLHQAIISKGRILKDEHGEQRRTRANYALTLYHGSWRYQFGEHGALDILGSEMRPEPVAYNLIQAAVDTKVAHIVRNKVHPLFVTENGDSDLKEKAQGCQRAVESVFHTAGVWGELGTQVCRHGCMFDGGGLKITPDYENHRPRLDLIYAHEFHVDPDEAERGDPRRGWTCVTKSREVLAAQFADDEKAQEVIAASKIASNSSTPAQDSIADMVEVWEYWHLPSGYVDLDDPASWGKEDEDGEILEAQHDGRHVLCTDAGTLLDEPWPYDYFPIAWFKPKRTAVGYWSCGVPETLCSAQVKINELNSRIDRIIKAHAVPRIIVSDRAKVNTQKWTNDAASIITVKGNPAQAAYYMVPQAVPAELFKRIDDIVRWSEKQIGLSEMSIAAMKPAGVDHAPGMQHLADTESIRHTPDFRAWESFHVDAAKILVDVFRLLAEHDEEFEVVFSDSKQLQRIKWTEVDMKSTQYHLRVWPTNLLPQTPGAKKSAVVDLMNAGLLSKEQGALALDFPDIESLRGDQTAALENIERMIDDALQGDQVIPEPYHNLQLAKTTIVNAINRSEADREKPERVERLRNLFTLVDRLIGRMTQEAAAQQAQGAAGVMPGPPGPPGPQLPPQAPAGAPAQPPVN